MDVLPVELWLDILNEACQCNDDHYIAYRMGDDDRPRFSLRLVCKLFDVIIRTHVSIPYHIVKLYADENGITKLSTVFEKIENIYYICVEKKKSLSLPFNFQNHKITKTIHIKDVLEFGNVDIFQNITRFKSDVTISYTKDDITIIFYLAKSKPKIVHVNFINWLIKQCKTCFIISNNYRSFITPDGSIQRIKNRVLNHNG